MSAQESPLVSALVWRFKIILPTAFHYRRIQTVTTVRKKIEDEKYELI
jgi:hypothetical protein